MLTDNPLSIDSASGQWNGRGSHVGQASFDSAEGELPLGAFNPILGLQYQNTSVDTQSAVLNITVKLTVKVAFKGQRLSKFDLCPVCPEPPEDTILTRWGIPIEDYTQVENSTVSVEYG